MTQGSFHNPPKKRVAIVASYAPSLLNFRKDLICKMISRGHDVLCLAPDFESPTRERLIQLGAQCEEIYLSRTGLSPIADLKTVRDLIQIFRRFHPDVVVGYTPKPAIYTSIAGARTGVGHIVPMITGLGYAFVEGSGIKHRLVRQMMKSLYKLSLGRAHGVIFHNRDDANYFRTLGVVPADLPVHVVSGSGVDLNYFSAEPPPPLNGEISFLMIARLVRYKGIAEFCEAARQVKLNNPGTHFVLLGPEEHGPAGFPRALLDEYKDDIEYLGPINDVREWLKRCHVYILPSYGEGMPRTVLEAMATGRPIITCDTRGCRDTVNVCENGYLVPIQDPDALASAMKRFINDPQLIPKMGRRSREIAEDVFDVGKVSQSMIEILAL